MSKTKHRSSVLSASPLGWLTSEGGSAQSSLVSCLLLTFIITTTLFFDVIFLDASLQPSNIVAHMGKPENYSTVSMVPTHERAKPRHGYSDLGSTAWQGEPARHFMARTFNNNESPYWNPYSASGSLGPETLSDSKFSFFTLTSAYFFESSPNSFDYGHVIIIALGIFSIIRICTRYLCLPAIAAIGAAVCFVLTGFATPNINSQNGQPYFFAPVLLLSLLGFSHAPSVLRLTGVALITAAMLSITILPVTVLTLISVHLINFATLVFPIKTPDGISQGATSCRSRLLIMCGHVTAVILAFCLVSPLWLPILESLFHSDLAEIYGMRKPFPPYSMDYFLNVFTPKHFWENYNGIRPLDVLRASGIEHAGGVLPHLGITACFIAAAAISRDKLKGNGLLIVLILMVLLPYARVFAIPPFNLIAQLPFFGLIGRQYWGCMSSLGFVFLVAIGIAGLCKQQGSRVSILVVCLVLAAAFLNLLVKMGFPEDHLFVFYIYVLSAITCIALVLLAFILREKPISGNTKHWLVLTLVGVMCVELFFYVNHLRPKRFSVHDTLPDYVQFLQDNVNDGRVLSIGAMFTLYPEFGSMFGIKQAGTTNSSTLPWYRDFYERNFGTSNRLFLVQGDSLERKQESTLQRYIDHNALDIASIKYIVVNNRLVKHVNYFRKNGYPVVFSQGKTLIFENADYMPNAYLVSNIVTENLTPDRHHLPVDNTVTTQATQWAQSAIDLGVAVNELPEAPGIQGSGAARVLAYTNAAITIETDTDKPEVLVLTDAWHPNWKAYVDDKLVQIGLVNEAFRGIAVPAGKHEVRLLYVPSSLNLAKTIFAFALLAIFLLFFLRKTIESKCRQLSSQQ